MPVHSLRSSRSISFVLSMAIAAVTLSGCRTESASPPPRMDVPTTMPIATPTTLARSAQPATTQASLASRLESILRRRSDHGEILSVRIVDPTSGHEIFTYDPGRPMAPASNMKLTVTSAAIDFFGPEKKLETNLIVVGQDLWLVGTGDPATGDERLEKAHGRTRLSALDDWAAELKSRGITKLAGNLYYVDNAFEKQQTLPTWSAGDLIEDYGAPIGGLNLNGNCIDTTVVPATQPTTQPGVPVKFTVVPGTTATIVIINNGVTGPATMPASKQTIDISRAVDQNTFTISGEAVKTTKVDSKPVTDPGAFFADALRTRLAANGITIAGSIVRGETVPTDASAITLKPAETAITDVIGRIMKQSQNTFAEGMAKYLGRAYAQQANRDSTAIGSWVNAEKAIRAFLAKNKIDDRDYRFHDGSGLSDENRVTARFLTEILIAMYHHAYFDTFVHLMSIGGVDGSLSDRFETVPGRVFAKTGYISGVRTLSGYAKTDSGKWLVFSILYNHLPGRGLRSAKPYEALQDEAVRTLISDPSVQ